VIEKAVDVAAKLSAVEEKILQVKSQSGQDPLNFPIKVNNKLAALTSVVSGSYYAPTQQSYDVFDMLSEELDGYITEYKGILEKDIPELNTMARSANLPPIAIKPPAGG
jgi:hypothetical protein